LILPGIDPYVYRLPALSVNAGDLIMISDNPLSVRYVVGYVPGGHKPGQPLAGLDPATGALTELIPAQNPFISFFVRLVSLFPPLGTAFGGWWGSGGWQEGKKRGADEGQDRPEGGDGPETGREGKAMYERPELGILVASMLLSQQPQGQTMGLNLQTLLPLLFLGGGRGLGTIELVALVYMLQQQSTSTGSVDGLALALFLSGLIGDEGGFPGWRRHGGFPGGYPGGLGTWRAEGGPQQTQEKKAEPEK
jgi:hypothetical protein